MLRYFTSRLSRIWSGSRDRSEATPTYVDRTSGVPLGSKVESLRQGYVFQIHSVAVSWNEAGEAKCPLGVVAVSQTCDLVRKETAEAQVAPVVTLNQTMANEARKGRRPRYAALPALGAEYFADLSLISTVHKSFLIGCESQPGLAGDDWRGEIDFSRAIGRRFDRFAFPDDVTPWLRPLQELMQSKAPKSGPVGRLAGDIAELRLEATDGWGTDPPYDLTLIVIVAVGVIPTLDENTELPDLESLPEEKVPQAAGDRPGEGATPLELVIFWERVAEALRRLCRPPDDAPESTKNAVRSLDVEIVTEDDLRYSRALRSVEIDLNHLSGPAYLEG